MKTKNKKPFVEVIYQPRCETCNGLCCRHIATNIDTPTRKVDYDNLRWYLMHQNVKVGIDLDGKWMLEVTTPCIYLQKDNLCAIYKTRPHICRDYPGKNDSCEHEDKSSPYTLLFNNDKELERYLRKKKPLWKWN